MRATLLRALVVLWVLLVVAAAVTSLVLASRRIDAISALLGAALCSALVGAILALKVPSNSVGPIALIAGSAGVIYLFGTDYGLTSLGSESVFWGVDFFAWLAAWVGALFPVGVSLLIMVFPTGRPLGWWRVLMIGPIVGFATTVIGAFLLWGLPVEVLADSTRISQIEGYGFVDAGFILGFFFSVPATVSVVARFRRAGFVERQQIKWLLAATCVFAVAYIAGAVTAYEWVWWIVGAAMAAIPLSILLAVLRYRLYEVDRIISRTVAYLIVIALLGAVYLGGLSAMTSLLPAESPLAVAGSTLAVAALFNPIRRRVQGWVDRRFNRSRYDAEKVMERFAGSLQGQVDSEGLVDGWVEVVSRTMQPASVAVWVRAEDRLRNDFGTLEG
jgi:hypothetical protein